MSTRPLPAGRFRPQLLRLEERAVPAVFAPAPATADGDPGSLAPPSSPPTPIPRTT